MRAITGLGLKEAKDLVEAGGKTVKDGVNKEEAAKLKKQLEDQGASSRSSKRDVRRGGERAALPQPRRTVRQGSGIASSGSSFAVMTASNAAGPRAPSAAISTSSFA